MMPIKCSVKFISLSNQQMHLKQLTNKQAGPTMAHKIFGANSSFYLEWRTTGKV